MASMLPLEAKSSALKTDISFFKAAIKATSEEKGSTVAAKNADKKRSISVILYS